MQFSQRSSILLVSGLVLLAGCDNDSSLVGSDPDDETAVVAGQVESTHATSASPAMASDAATVAAEASTVAVAAVQSDGALQVLAEAEVQADGRFHLEDVPAARSGLVVSARSAGGDEVGRVLVHGETRGGVTTTTAPINAETTVQGLVHQRLAAAGVSAEIRNTAQLALLLRMDESTAAEVAASAQAIQAVADAYVKGASALDQSLAAMGESDQAARIDVLVEGRLDYARSRDQGQSSDAAHDAFLDVALDALVAGGADLDAAALATAAAATGLDRAMEEADPNARLDLAKNAVELNLRTRSKLAGEAGDSDAASIAASALADARANVRASESLDQVIAALAEVEAEAGDALQESIMDRLPEEVPEVVRAQLRVRLDTAFASADLSARLDGSADVQSIVDAVVAHREQVRSAVEAFVDELPADAEVRAEVLAELLIAVKGGPDLHQDG